MASESLRHGTFFPATASQWAYPDGGNNLRQSAVPALLVKPIRAQSPKIGREGFESNCQSWLHRHNVGVGQNIAAVEAIRTALMH